MALTPDNFGDLSNYLLVGNFGDGYINVFDPNTGQYKGQLRILREILCKLMDFGH